MISKFGIILKIFLFSFFIANLDFLVCHYMENASIEKVSSRRNVIDPGFSYEDGSDLGGLVSYTSIYLNDMNSVTVNSGEIKYFTYTPDAGYHFVVETFGQHDTKLRIENTSTGMIVDDNNGIDNNAKIEFLGVQSQPLYISVRLADYNSQGTFDIQFV